MRKEEYEKFKKSDTKPRLITIEDLINKEERTLLYGFTCERDTWHVYIKNNEIITIRYPYNQKPTIVTVQENEGYIPDKRLYPETCDYEFCKLLFENDCYLPFTVWRERAEEKYYGEII